MSKASSKAKKSKSYKKKTVEKSQKKAEEKAKTREIIAASTPVQFSLKENNYGKAPTSVAQLVFLGIGATLLIFGYAATFNFIADFVAIFNEGFTISDYFSACEPLSHCLILDISQILTIFLSIISSIIPLKIFFTNKYSKPRALKFMVFCIVITLICYLVSFFTSKIF